MRFRGKNTVESNIGADQPAASRGSPLASTLFHGAEPAAPEPLGGPLLANIEASPHPHLWFSPERRIIAANSAALDLLGEPEGQALGPLDRYLSAADLESFCTHLNQVFETGLPQRIQVRLLTRGGASRVVAVKTSLLVTESGVLCTSSLVDREREVELEGELASARALLLREFDLLLAVSPVGRITSAFRADRLSSGVYTDDLEGRLLDEVFPGAFAQIAASRSPVVVVDAPSQEEGEPRIEISVVSPSPSNAELLLGLRNEISPGKRTTREDFLAMMSHDIRTPMNGILGFASLLKETKLNAEQEEYLRYITDNGHSLLRLLNDILEFVNADSGRIALQRQPFHLRRTLEEVISVGVLGAAEKNLQLYYDLDPSLPAVVVGDVARLHQVLVNLIANAVKFTEHGEVGLAVFRSIGGEPLRARFEVSDTGVGIAPDVAGRLFEPFRQTDPLRPRSDRGTGLGLAISRRIVELMGGSISVRSEPGQGSTFYFDIPLAQAPDLAEPPGLAGSSVLRGKRVLVIEASRNQGRALSSMLRSLAAIPVLPGSPDEREVLDAALVGIPGEPGETLKTQLQARGVPVVKITQRTSGHAEGEEILRPVTEPELSNALIRVLTAERAPLARDEKQTRPTKIMVADDSPDNQRLMKIFLRNIGFDTDSAEDGIQTVNAMKREHYPIALLDISMPGLDGCHAAVEIRKYEAEHNLPPSYLVAVTAHSLPGDRERFLECGMDDYLSKPINEPQLRAVLERAEQRVRLGAGESKSS